MAVDAVIFDWGGTLAEYVSLEMVDVWRLAARHLDPAREDEIAERLLAVEEAFWDRTASSMHSGTLADLVAEASGQLGLDVAEAVMEEAALRHLDAWTPHIRHDPDAALVLSALRERGIRIGLLSNTHWPRPFLERFLARDGLEALIDVRVYTSETPYMKPHPTVFRAALEALGIDDPARAVHVGDRLLDDVTGAQGAGLRAVHRRNDQVPAHPARPDATIEALPELLAVVEGWHRSA